MSEKTPSLSLDPVGREFKLTRVDDRGQKTEIILSEDNILTLAQAAQRLQDLILARHTRQGADAVSLVPVAQIELNTDLHLSQIHLAMIDAHGAKTGYALPLEVAEPLADRLPKRIADLKSAKKQQH